LKDIVSDIQATGDHINQLFPLPATNVNYTNVENKVKTVQVRFCEIDNELKI
jgi:hypothetical protein